jgi:hypothetical protein
VFQFVESAQFETIVLAPGNPSVDFVETGFPAIVIPPGGLELISNK